MFPSNIFMEEFGSEVHYCTGPSSAFISDNILRNHCYERISFLILYLTSLQLVLCRVAAVKRLPVHQP